MENGHRVATGYSPFTADKYSIDLPDNASPFHDEEKEILKEDKRDSS